MTLRQKQSIFTFLVARLIIHANENGYELTFGECYRTPEQAQINADKGIGISNSLHIKRLAIDLNLFKDGKFLDTSDAHKLLGEWWERQHNNCRWGGRWNDGNHYEFTETAWR
jgi:hypothetical protein